MAAPRSRPRSTNSAPGVARSASPVITSVQARSRGRPPVISTERLLEVARDVFLELGIRATTAEVAARAKIAEGTIFHRFKSKEELFRAAMNFDPDAPLALVEALPELRGRGDLRQTLIDFSRRFLQLGRVALPVWMMAWSNPESQLCAQRSSERASRYARVLGGLTAFLEEEMRAGRLRRSDPEVMSRMLIGSLQHFCMIELFTGFAARASSYDDFASKAVDVLLAAPQ